MAGVYAYPCVDSAFVIGREHPYRASWLSLVTDSASEADGINAEWNNLVQKLKRC